jgi:hypothetical protein
LAIDGEAWRFSGDAGADRRISEERDEAYKKQCKPGYSQRAGDANK